MPSKVNNWSWSGIKSTLLGYLKFIYKVVSFLAGPSIFRSVRMPAHCGDPVSSALQHSLLSQRRLKDSSALDFKLISNAKQILDSCIKYETVFASSNQQLDQLKSQYTVLSTLGASSSSQLLSPASSSSSASKSPVPSGSQHGNRSQPERPQTPSGPALPVPKKVLYPPEAVTVGWQNTNVPVGSGFTNMGNTCYLNSTLQALFHVPAFVNWLTSDKQHFHKCEMMNGMTHSECLVCAMAKTLQTSHKLTGQAIKPSNIVNKLRLICKHLSPGQQEDAHEFLRYLMEGMERSYLSVYNGLRLDNVSKETTPLGQIFGGYIRTEVTCLECKHISTTFQHFQDLILDIRTANSVDDALEHYFARERLGDDGDHAYKCEQCKRRVAATKKFSLERPPKVLCIQLKRFGVLGGKNNKNIATKEVLNLTKFRHKPPPGSNLRYRLVAMVNHLGHSASCGHYTACGMASTGSYYQFDDSVVRPVSVSNVLSLNPYILIYELDAPAEVVKEREKSPLKTSLSVPLTNGTSNGTSPFKTSNTDKLKSSPSKSSYGRLSPLKFNVKLSQSAPNLPSVSSSPKASTPSQAASASPSPASSISSLSSAQSKSPPSSSCTSVNRSPEKPSTSQQSPQKTKSPSSERPVLVPYLSESSDSESESTPTQNKPATQTPSHNSQPSTNGWAKADNRDEKTGKRSASESSIPPEKRNGDICRPSSAPLKVEVEKSWPSTPARTDMPSPAGSVSSGKWSVTSYEKDRSPDRPKENGQAQNNTVQSLLRMSHQGYGHSGINTWNGSRSQIDKEVADDREAVKRSRNDYDDDFDRGKVKKMKYNHNNHVNSNNNRNRFQEFQNFHNRKNNKWHNRPPRQDFYRNYVFKQNGNYNNRFNNCRWQQH